MNTKLPPPMDAPAIDLSVLSTPVNRNLEPAEAEALSRLLDIAKHDTGQSRRVADFLLAWWNSGKCGAFDLTNLWSVDAAIAADMVTVFAAIARVSSYPDSLGYELDFKAIARAWRPELVN